MVLRAPWGSLGVVLGALEGFLGALWVVLGAPWELQVARQLLKKGFWSSLRLLFVVLVVLLLASSSSTCLEVVPFSSSGAFFFSSWSVARSILSSRDDRPTLTHSTHSTHSRQRPQAWGSWLRRSQVGKGRRVPRRAYNLASMHSVFVSRGRLL